MFETIAIAIAIAGGNAIVPEIPHEQPVAVFDTAQAGKESAQNVMRALNEKQCPALDDLIIMCNVPMDSYTPSEQNMVRALYARVMEKYGTPCGRDGFTGYTYGGTVFLNEGNGEFWQGYGPLCWAVYQAS